MVTDRRTDGRTEQPTLLSIELLSQLKLSLTPVFHQLLTIYNYLVLQNYSTIVQLQKLVVVEQLTDILTYRATFIANRLALRPIELSTIIAKVLSCTIIISDLSP